MLPNVHADCNLTFPDVDDSKLTRHGIRPASTTDLVCAGFPAATFVNTQQASYCVIALVNTSGFKAKKRREPNHLHVFYESNPPSHVQDSTNVLAVPISSYAALVLYDLKHCPHTNIYEASVWHSIRIPDSHC